MGTEQKGMTFSPLQSASQHQLRAALAGVRGAEGMCSKCNRLTQRQLPPLLMATSHIIPAWGQSRIPPSTMCANWLTSLRAPHAASSALLWVCHHCAQNTLVQPLVSREAVSHQAAGTVKQAHLVMQ